ncbi:guanylate kinase [Mycoplasmopsis caviae]|uniref:Guanylate kinase n=1 Tax=Mycoplasmopsis caviae TaxID=55603 RepID=A0A3P8KM47_9BACT|nr:guanylate kinase [Mycoplasmopsis caviae]UUD35363.1 guanylate kinase [Mycoplasmopsis caviae]VDR41858.1 guanylate kinase [Mycoplasmopsis caviae]
MNNLISNRKPIIIFTGPSGVGKGTIEKYLFDFKELKLHLSCSATTRAPREGEIDGTHYFFISKDEFKNHIQNDELFEYSFHFDNYYGTLYSQIEKIHHEGKIPVLEIETNGARQILQKVANNKNYKLITFFILPPSIDELERRIINRKTEGKEAIKKRLEKAQAEIAEKDIFRHHIINDDPLRAANEIKEIIEKEYGIRKWNME